MPDAARSRLLSPAMLAGFGETLVVAPHPDDESLGCGGALASLAWLGLTPRVLVMSDGRGSHPRSRCYPAPRLRALRERETRKALAILGVPPVRVWFRRLPDCGVPRRGEAGFGAEVVRLRRCLRHWRPTTLLLPWRRDHHRDHAASWQLVDAALSILQPRPRCLEYLIWSRERADLPRPGEARHWRLPIRRMVPRKRAAVGAHRSQLGELIPDDPGGFRLTAADLARLVQPEERYLEVPRG